MGKFWQRVLALLDRNYAQLQGQIDILTNKDKENQKWRETFTKASESMREELHGTQVQAGIYRAILLTIVHDRLTQPRILLPRERILALANNESRYKLVIKDVDTVAGPAVSVKVLEVS